MKIIVIQQIAIDWVFMFIVITVVVFLYRRLVRK